MTEEKTDSRAKRRPCTDPEVLIRRRATAEERSLARGKEARALKALGEGRSPKHPRTRDDLDVETLYGVTDDGSDTKRSVWSIIASMSTVRSTGERSRWVHPHPSIDDFDDIILVSGRFSEGSAVTVRQVPLKEALQLIAREEK